MAVRRTGFVAYEGPSLLGPQPIVVIFTPDSTNPKTGDMVQAWVLLRDVQPNEAIRARSDVSVCGSCVHRHTGVGGKRGRTCYVSMFSGPVHVWRAYKRGTYPRADARDSLRGEHVRVTAYGDAAALPFEWWANALSGVAGWTGYTHQWQTCDARFALLLMASVESTSEADAAHAAGYRTYRARPVDGPLLRTDATSASLVRRDEFVCPASDEGGHRTTCRDCQLCRGQSSPAKHVAIELHGLRFKSARGEAIVQRRAELDRLRVQLEAGATVSETLKMLDAHRLYLALRRFYRYRSQLGLTVRSSGLGWRGDRDSLRDVKFWLERREQQR